MSEQAEATGLRPTVYTIGHGNLSIEALVAALREAGVDLVVDVRSTPYSQYNPQFNRETLQRSLAERDIGYRFAGDSLGGRPSDPTCYKVWPPPDEREAFLDAVDYDAVAERPWFRRGLERLIELAGSHTAAMMCSEEDPQRCHRYHLIAQALLPVADVVDIRTSGSEGVLLRPALPKPKQIALL